MRLLTGCLAPPVPAIPGCCGPCQSCRPPPLAPCILARFQVPLAGAQEYRILASLLHRTTPYPWPFSAPLLFSSPSARNGSSIPGLASLPLLRSSGYLPTTNTTTHRLRGESDASTTERWPGTPRQRCRSGAHFKSPRKNPPRLSGQCRDLSGFAGDDDSPQLCTGRRHTAGLMP